MVFRFVFFFQAEDGIRDHCVTGVQTCALPIYMGAWSAASASSRSTLDGCTISNTLSSGKLCWGPRESRTPSRSEERRVGKECRSRWSRYHQKKKRCVRGE